MSYDPKLLFEQISAYLNEDPRKALEELSQNLHVSKRTIKKSVRLATGGNFRQYREEVLLERVKGFFAMQPGVAIKVLSIDLGFRSPSSFARAIRRASGACPGDLRANVLGELTVADKARRLVREPLGEAHVSDGPISGERAMAAGRRPMYPTEPSAAR